MGSKVVCVDAAEHQVLATFLAPIYALIARQDINDVCINKYNQVYIKRRGGYEHVPGAGWENEADFVAAIRSIARTLGMDHGLGEERPILDARLADGSRIAAILRPASVQGPQMTIRTFPQSWYSADDLMTMGTYSRDMLSLFRLAMRLDINILVAGSTGSGKTSLVAALLGLSDVDERVIVLEDTNELSLNKPQAIYYEAASRMAKHRSEKIVSMAQLLQHSLRNAPDRIVVGELRHPDVAYAWNESMNTGHAGSLATIHASSAHNALVRLDNMIVASDCGMPYQAIQTQTRCNVGLVIFCKCSKHYGHKVTEVLEVNHAEETLLWKWSGKQQQHLRLADHSLIETQAQEEGVVI